MTVTGPITEWDADEVSAIASVVLVQAVPGHGIVLAGGIAARVENPTLNAQWLCPRLRLRHGPRVATVTRPGVSLEPGSAVAYAHALIENSAGAIEPYQWIVHVIRAVGELISHQGGGKHALKGRRQPGSEHRRPRGRGRPGQISEWDSDEKSARPSRSCIAQVEDDGRSSSPAARRHATYRERPKTWKATRASASPARVSSTGRRRPGRSRRSPKRAAGSSSYPWSLETHLVDDVVAAPAAR